MTDAIATEERDGARIRDLRVADDGEAFVVEPVGGGRGPAVLRLHWFDTEALDRAAFLRVIIDETRDG